MTMQGKDPYRTAKILESKSRYTRETPTTGLIGGAFFMADENREIVHR